MFHGGGVHVNVAASLMLLLKDDDIYAPDTSYLKTKGVPAQIKLADSWEQNE